MEEIKYYSQDGQDQYIHQSFFKNKKNGFYIEIGANNGISLSNTLVFEQLGWSGLGVEPLPDVYDQLIQNRTCECVNGVISNSDEEEIEFLQVSGYAEMLSGILSEYDPEHLNRVNRELVLHGGEKQIIKIKNYKFNDLVKETKISYLSIDTEGSELSILKSIDFDKYDIDVISVENNFNDPELIDFVVSKGYTHVITLGADNIFLSNLFNII